VISVSKKAQNDDSQKSDREQEIEFVAPPTRLSEPSSYQVVLLWSDGGPNARELVAARTLWPPFAELKAAEFRDMARCAESLVIPKIVGYLDAADLVRRGKVLGLEVLSRPVESEDDELGWE
jgi:hypothetical protein